MLADVFNDILFHTHGLSFIEMVKLVTDKQETKIEAMHPDRAVVVYGTLKDPIPDLEGTVGLARMAVLQGYLKFPPFMSDGTTVKVVSQQRDGNDIPAEISFESQDGHSASYRFMYKDAAEEQIKVPRFKGASWDVVITPTEGNMKELSYFNNVLGTFEPVFTAKTDGTDLKLYIGSGATDRATVPFASNVSGKLSGKWSWPLVPTLAILKLASKAEDCTMSFSEKGVLKIEMSTPFGTYEYLLSARSK